MTENGDTLQVPQHVISKAMAIVDAYQRNAQSWPEDHWITLDSEWDLNLWCCAVYKRAGKDVNITEIVATVYPAPDGKTDTSDFKEVFRKEIK